MTPNIPLTPKQQQSIAWSCCTEMAKRSMPGNYVYILLFISVYWVAVMCVIHQEMIFYGGVTLIGCCISRAYLSFQIDAWQDSLKRWRFYFSACTLSIASIWSALAIHQWLEFGMNQYTMLLLLLVMGILYGALSVLSLFKTLFRAFAVVLLLPLVIFGLFQQDAMSFTISNIFFIGLIFSISVATKLSKSFISNLEFTVLMQDKEQEIQRFAKKSRAESEAKSTFLANMSHEIRTPMNGVIGMTEMLQQTNLDAKQAAFVQVIDRSSHALLSIINDILDYSKIESGHLKLEHQRFDLRELTDEIMALMAHKGQHKSLEVILDIAPDIPCMYWGDAGRIRQILINLLGNAIKFTQEGEVVLRISKDQQTDAQHCLRFAVVDTGIGIPQAALQPIFDSFSQADNSTTRRFGGTGLGLAICRQLTELMGGNIEVQSQEGEGSTFSFAITLEHDPSHEKAQPIAADILDKLRQNLVLIVDDNSHHREVISQQLHAWNIEHDTVDCAAKAWQMLNKDASSAHYSTVLLDMHMSGIHGLELASMLRDHAVFADIRIIMMCTGSQDMDDISQQPNLVDDTINKPVQQHSLLHILLPQDQSHTPSQAIQASKPNPLQASTLELQQAHVLIAEDNLVNQEVLVAMLELLGCKSSIANNGLEVLSALEQQHFDLILMDCHMPQMDGLEATKQIRQRQDALANITIIALTANAMPEDRDHCLKIGMTDYLSKPFTQKQLQHVLLQYISTNQEEQQNTPPDKPIHHIPNAPIPLQRTPVLDEACLNNLRQLQQPGAANILHKVMHIFLDDAPKHLHTMHQALNKNDFKTLNFSAHTLKSSSANMGATQLTSLCAKMEKLAALADPDDKPQLLASLKQADLAYEQVCQEIMDQHLHIEEAVA